jgi:hypothetical protein
MTASFCTRCGAPLAAEARFCTACGQAAALPAAVTASTPPPAHVCARCGADLDPGARFCTSCGAATAATPVAATALPAAPRASQSQRRLLLALAGAGALAVAVVLIASATSGDDNDSTSSQGTTSAQSGSTPSSGGAGTPQSQPTVRALLMHEITPVAVNISLPAGQLNPSPNLLAASELEIFMREQGINLAGVNLTVRAVNGTNDNMMIIGMDESASTNLLAAPAPMQTVLASPPMQRFRITRLALILRSRDGRGTFTMTMTMPVPIALAMLNNTLTDAQFQQQVQYRISRP